jgi:hypothetical protein
MSFRFNRHMEIEGRHSFLSPSKPHWVNYDDQKLLMSFDKHMTAALGTRLHAFAHDAISLGIKMEDNSKTLNRYINDCIGFRMRTEVPLVFSANAFGTADAIDFDGARQLLRVFDLKNGSTHVSERQLEVYAALFCLEYRVKPMKIDYDLRIYQNDAVAEFDTDPEDIVYIMDRIKHFDQLIEAATKEV